MNSFFNSNHCKLQTHCKTCRDKEGGRKFRQSLMKTFDDIKTEDFDCPSGFKWGQKVKAKPNIVSERLLKLSHSEIIKEIKNISDDEKQAEGLQVIEEETEKILNAGCKPCAKNQMTARLRLWLARATDEC